MMNIVNKFRSKYAIAKLVSWGETWHYPAEGYASIGSMRGSSLSTRKLRSSSHLLRGLLHEY